MNSKLKGWLKKAEAIEDFTTRVSVCSLLRIYANPVGEQRWYPDVWRQNARDGSVICQLLFKIIGN